MNVYRGGQLIHQDVAGTGDFNPSGQYRLVTISHKGMSNGQQVDIVRSYDQHTPPEDFYYVALLGTDQPSSVDVNGQPVSGLVCATPEEATEALADSGSDADYYNANIETTLVKVFDTAPKLQVVALW